MLLSQGPRRVSVVWRGACLQFAFVCFAPSCFLFALLLCLFLLSRAWGDSWPGAQGGWPAATQAIPQVSSSWGWGGGKAGWWAGGQRSVAVAVGQKEGLQHVGLGLFMVGTTALMSSWLAALHWRFWWPWHVYESARYASLLHLVHFHAWPGRCQWSGVGSWQVCISAGL